MPVAGTVLEEKAKAFHTEIKIEIDFLLFWVASGTQMPYMFYSLLMFESEIKLW